MIPLIPQRNNDLRQNIIIFLATFRMRLYLLNMIEYYRKKFENIA